MDCSNSHLIKETSGESSNTSLDRFLELPEDAIRDILHRLGAYEILKNAQRVCSSWRKICKDPSMWRVIDMKHLFAEYDYEYLEHLCRQAIDRSQGQLTEIHIDLFPTDELLDFISERSSQLRCLRIGNCEVEEGRLIALAKKCPLLEDLHLVELRDVNYSIEAIGQSCPNLKSFTLSYCRTVDQHHVINFQARAIAKSMPGLRHLRVVGNDMTNEGLEAILDGCPNLESLDIRNCTNVDLGRGEIGARIAQEIKYFKRPNDPLEPCDMQAGLYYFYYGEYEDEDEGLSYTYSFRLFN